VKCQLLLKVSSQLATLQSVNFRHCTALLTAVSEGILLNDFCDLVSLVFSELTWTHAHVRYHRPSVCLQSVVCL